MRIIAGQHRGRRILAPEGLTTRPITDRVKQSLFDRLASSDQLEGAIVLDIFSGTGSLGLECLSRGAEHVTFIEQDRSAAKLLEQNLAMLGEMTKARIMRVNAMGGGLMMGLPRRSYSLIFVDPPYPLVADDKKAGRLWELMEGLAPLADVGCPMVLRVERHQEPPSLAGWGPPQKIEYGSMNLVFYVRPATPEGPVNSDHG
jgi:16S rRNA (guanine966-N2)-methyltransferase